MQLYVQSLLSLCFFLLSPYSCAWAEPYVLCNCFLYFVPFCLHRISASMLKGNSNLLNLLCFIYFCFLVYMPKVTAGFLVWGLGVICCLPAFLPTHSLRIRPLKCPQSRKKRKKMTSMESKLYQLSVNRHTLEDFRFSCWGIFSHSEYTTPWGKESLS